MSKRHEWISRINLVLVVAIFVSTACAYGYVRLKSSTTSIQYIDQSFSGINASMEIDKTVRLLVVHGIGTHCIGYADSLVQGVAGESNSKPLLSSASYDNWLESISKVRENKHNKEIKDLENIRLVTLSKEELEKAQLLPFYPLLDSHCTPIDSGKMSSIDNDYNSLEQSKIDTCRAIHNAKGNDTDCQKLTLTFKYFDQNTKSEKKSTFVVGFIRVKNYHFGNSPNSTKPALKLYELTWDTTTRWAKSRYISHDRHFDSKRDLANRLIKMDVINQSVSDAILYLGKYQSVMQYPILQAFCKLVVDGSLQNSKFDFECPLENLDNLSLKDFSSENELAIISHSLGTRMVFDSLGILGNGDRFFEKYTNKLVSENNVVFATQSSDYSSMANYIRNVFSTSLGKIFALTNQVPLLELASLSNPFDFGLGHTQRDLGNGFRNFLVNRDISQQPLQITSFSDPNDLLTYNLKCWYYLHVLRHQPHVRQRAVQYHNETGQDLRTFHEKLFSDCSMIDSDRGKESEFAVKWRDIYDELWLSEDSINLADVSVNLRGLQLPSFYSDPNAAHTNYFDEGENNIFKLIAQGGEASNQSTKNVHTKTRGNSRYGTANLIALSRK